MRFLPLTLIFLALPNLFHAQQRDRDSITNLGEVVLTERGTVKQALGLTPSSLLAVKDLQRNGPLDLASSINQISGVYLLSGTMNTNRITIRGIGARTLYGTDKLRMYFNNIPVTNGTGFSELEAYDLENLEGIEVIKGPKGTAHGTNLGGAIILNTKIPEVGGTYFVNNATLGSYGMFKDNMAFRHSDGNFNISLGYNRLQTEGYRENNKFEKDGLLLTSSIRLGDHGKLDLLLNHIDYVAQIPSSLNRDDLEHDPTKADANWLAAQGYEANKYTLAGLTYSHNFKGSLRNSSSIFYTYLDHYEPRPFNILDEFTNGYGARTVFNGKFLKGRFALGGELYRDRYHWGTIENLYQDNEGQGSLEGERLSKNIEHRNQFNLFGSYEFPLAGKLSAQVGVNLNKTKYDYRDRFNTGEANKSAKRDFSPIASPSLQLRHPLKTGHMFVSASRGFSNPGLEETLNPEGVVNPYIEQEKGMSYEAGVAFDLLNGALRVEGTLYLMHIKDLLVAQRVGDDQYIGRNAGKTRHQGLELEARYRIVLSNTLSVLPYMSYTLNDHKFVDFRDGELDHSGNPLTGVPKHRLSSGMDLEHSGLGSLHLTHQFVDKIPLTDANTAYSNAHNILNLSARSSLPLGAKLKLSFGAGINNIFDTNYAASVLINAVGFGSNPPRYFYPGNGRNFYGSLGFSLFL